MDRRYEYLTILLLGSLLSACSSKPVEEGYSFHISEERGVSVARTTNGPKYSSSLFSLEEVVRVYEDESIQESLITRPRWMGIDEEGTIYILDKLYGSSPGTWLRVYNQDGTYSHQIGRHGQGPGEYNDPVVLDISNGVITMFDSRFRRISWFSRDGSFLRLFTSAPGQALPERAYIDEEGNQILIYFHFPMEGNWRQREAIVRSSDGDLLGEIKTRRIPSHQGLVTSSYQWATPNHFGGAPLIDYSPLHGIMKTNGNEPVIEWFDQNGEFVKIFDLGLTPSPVSEEGRALVDRYYDGRYDDNKALQPIYRELQRKIDRYPEKRSFWDEATIDEYGYLWLLDPSSHWHPTERHYRVVSPEGEYLGDCFLPQGIARVSHGYYLLIDQDRDRGVQEFIVYRLVATVEGLEFPY